MPNNDEDSGVARKARGQHQGNASSSSNDGDSDRTPIVNEIVDTSFPLACWSVSDPENVRVREALDKYVKGITDRMNSKYVLTYLYILNSTNGEREMVAFQAPENLQKISEILPTLPRRTKFHLKRNVPPAQRKASKVLTEWVKSQWQIQNEYQSDSRDGPASQEPDKDQNEIE